MALFPSGLCKGNRFSGAGRNGLEGGALPNPIEGFGGRIVSVVVAGRELKACNRALLHDSEGLSERSAASPEKARRDSVSALDETGLTRHKHQLLLDRLCSSRVADAVRRNDLGPFFVAIQDFNGLRG